MFEVPLKTAFLRADACDARSLVAIPHAKPVRSVGSLSVTQLSAVENAVRIWLGL